MAYIGSAVNRSPTMKASHFARLRKPVWQFISSLHGDEAFVLVFLAFVVAAYLTGPSNLEIVDRLFGVADHIPTPDLGALR